ncbi:hypothetical protein A8C56_08930 [Niabella ginsenosidivorans]|uniref:Uncharacterized protein n=1 Tax=Niabella ginsenosidivorans TaxID=1176587 RepID=A0A1A9I0D6_9BACT|nr:hypothetical protein A8C56_08930 [Niabella ginsenosidivorans]
MWNYCGDILENQKDTKALINLRYRTKQDELRHIIIMVIILGVTVFVAIKFGILKSLWLLILTSERNYNCLFTIPPVLLCYNFLR